MALYLVIFGFFFFQAFWQASLPPRSEQELGVERGAEPDLGLWGKKEEAKEMMSGSAQATLPGGTGSVK